MTQPEFHTVAQSLPELESDRSQAGVLRRRLTALGLSSVHQLVLHRNRTVVITLTPRGALRLHEGFCTAPDRVLRAIIRFLRPGTAPAVRRAARYQIVTFPVEVHAPARRRRVRIRPEDLTIVEELGRRHRELNDRHFDGRLGPVMFRLSRRMRTRLGQLTADPDLEHLEIAISRRHALRDGWDQVQETLLHEMIHQWQAENGLPLDHRARFRDRARALGISPLACRPPT